jgi:hypothetical protein
VAAQFFGGDHHAAQQYLKEHGLMPKMLDKSRFDRRLHRLFLPLLYMFDYWGTVVKVNNFTTEYLLDSLFHRCVLSDRDKKGANPIG